MAKCLNCGTELNDDNKCPRCKQQSAVEVDWSLLTTVANDIEFEMVAGLLQMGDIPVIRKVKGIDGFIQIILGMPLAGIDIYVPKDRFEEAMELLNSDVNEEEFLAEEKETEKENISDNIDEI
jgi:hypothetical protein